MSAEVSRGYALGDRVRIVDLGKPGHVRTPRYVRGKTGTIDHCCGQFENPENRAYGRVGRERIPLYRVRCCSATCGPTTKRSERFTGAGNLRSLAEAGLTKAMP
jgi:nitrile hydratase